MSHIILFNKPYGVLSQFTAEGAYQGLSAYIDEPGFYAAGRLDATSEGLLILTDDGSLQARISSPKFKLWKTYWAQLEGDIDQSAIEHLQRGVRLKDGTTLPAKCRKIQAPSVDERDPPIRKRANIPTSWIELTIREGKNRQVRRMTAAVGFPTLRLIRVRIGHWELGGITSGQYVKVDPGYGLNN